MNTMRRCKAQTLPMILTLLVLEHLSLIVLGSSSSFLSSNPSSSSPPSPPSSETTLTVLGPPEPSRRLANTASSNERLIVFGDDYCDTGNLLASTNDSSVGYSNGRMTNGPVFVEYMSTLLGRTLTNYAYAQSTINNTMINSTYGDFQIPSLSDQVLNFTESEKDWIRRRSGVKDAIVVINSGSTDVLRQEAPYDTLNPQFSKRIVTEILGHVQNLANLGLQKIMICNLPAIYLFPTWQASPYVDLARDFIKSTNKLFNESVGEFVQSRKIKLWLLDQEAFLLVAANSSFASTIGAKNTTSTTSCMSSSGGSSSACGNQTDFVFYDDVHFDVRLHHLLGLSATELIQNNTVQYSADYFAQLASSYDIGVLRHENITTSDINTVNVKTTAGDDPLVTTSSTLDNSNCTYCLPTNFYRTSDDSPNRVGSTGISNASYRQQASAITHKARFARNRALLAIIQVVAIVILV